MKADICVSLFTDIHHVPGALSYPKLSLGYCSRNADVDSVVVRLALDGTLLSPTWCVCSQPNLPDSSR